MALTQIQIIQSLGEAMSWFERELSWGCQATELRHLVGRIGELYAALITNGQMALEVNQKGYDVVSASGERVSVKTTGTLSDANRMVSFNPETIKHVDRVMILRINSDEMQVETLLDLPVDEAKKLMTKQAKKLIINLSKISKKAKAKSTLKTVKCAVYNEYEIKELENGSIEIETEGGIVPKSMPMLLKIAESLKLQVLNGNGTPLNTRQLGSNIIRHLAQSQLTN